MSRKKQAERMATDGAINSTGFRGCNRKPQIYSRKNDVSDCYVIISGRFLRIICDGKPSMTEKRVLKNALIKIALGIPVGIHLVVK
jgi:hypothetical protein